jgi:hypothetical protein
MVRWKRCGWSTKEGRRKELYMLIREAFLDDLNAVGHIEMHFANEGMYAGCKRE